MAEPYFASIGKDYWELDDSEKQYKTHPYSYQIPKKRDRETLQPTDLAKLSFSTITFDKDNIPILRNERMWVEVKQVKKSYNKVINMPIYYGTLFTECVLNENLSIGLEVWFEPKHIMNITRAKDYLPNIKQTRREFLQKVEKEKTLENKKDAFLKVCINRFGKLTSEIEEYILNSISSIEELNMALEKAVLTSSLLELRSQLLGRKGINHNDYLEKHVKELIRKQEESNYKDYSKRIKEVYTAYKEDSSFTIPDDENESISMDFLIKLEVMLVSFVGSQIQHSNQPTDVETRKWFERFLENTLESKISSLQKTKEISSISEVDQKYLDAFIDIAKKITKDPVEAWNIFMKLNIELGIGLHPTILDAD